MDLLDWLFAIGALILMAACLFAVGLIIFTMVEQHGEDDDAA